MNFLFLTDEFHPNFGANSLVVRTVCRGLAEKGHRVFVAPAFYDGSLPAREEWEGIEIVRGMPGDTKDNFKNYLKQGHFVTATKLLHVLLWAKVAGPHKLGPKKGICARSWLEDLIRQEKIDVAVSINCSMERGFPLLYLKEKRKISAKWYLYMLDPFESHEYYRRNNPSKWLKKTQHRMMKSCDAVLATELIYRDTALWETKAVLDKVCITEFPKVCKPEYKPCADELTLPQGTTNVVCTGSKDDVVRDSAFALAICKQIKGAQFHFMGNDWTDEDRCQEGNLFFYKPRSWQAAKNMQLQADCLLNIGNAVPNQMPSKILEYISTGKPIINTYKTPVCPTLSVLNKYCSALNIFETNNTEDGVAQLQAFLSQPKRTMPYEEIERTYMKYTIDSVVDKFIENANR